MRKKSLLASVVIILVSFSSVALAGNNKKIVAETKTTFGWQVLTDKDSETKLKVVAGPGKKKAIQLNFKFGDSVWIAVVKEISIALAKNEGIKFTYTGSGASVNVKIKLFDSGGTVFSYTLPRGTAVPVWQEIIIPRSCFEYLWGGKGAESMNWNNITKFEITLDVNVLPDVSYVIDKSKPGKVAFSDIHIVKIDATKSKIIKKTLRTSKNKKKTKGKKIKSGYLIDAMNSKKGWTTLSDQDGSCRLSTTRVIINKRKSAEALKAEFDFGNGGIWNAILKPTNLDLSSMRFIRFRYKGTGGSHKLIFKLMDANERVFGYALNSTTNTKGWKSVIIPKNALQYLYGGNGAGDLNYSSIKKIEFTIEKKDENISTGILYLRWLAYK